MRIALLLPYDLDYHGGVREVVLHLADEYVRLGHEPTIVAPSSSTAAAATGRLISVETQPAVLPVNGATARVLGLDPSAWNRVVDLIRFTPFDVVHLHEPILWLPLLIGRFERIRPAWIGTFHAAGEPGQIGDIDDLAGRVASNLVANLRRSGGARSLPAWSSAAQRLGIHLDPRVRLGSSPRRMARFGRPLLQSLLGRLDATVAVSRTARDSARSYGVTPAEIIPNGVDTAAFARLAARPVPSATRPTVLFFSRLDERKGLATLIRAMPSVTRRVPGVRLIVAGNFSEGDEDQLRYRAVAREVGVSVEFVASPSDERKIALFGSATVLCAPALGQESFGIVLAEALAAGLPIVASDLGAFRDVLDDGKLGVLAPPGDPDSLADALVRLLSDAGLRGRLSRAGRNRVGRYAWEVVARQNLGVYVQTLERVPIRSPDGVPILPPTRGGDRAAPGDPGKRQDATAFRMRSASVPQPARRHRHG